MATQKFYVVWKGRTPGIYHSWDACKQQIDKFTGALYKAFADKTMAEKAFKEKPHKHIANTRPKKNLQSIGTPQKNSISVDAACAGNPGILEYRGVETHSGKQLFHAGPFPAGTVNIGEFLALVHGLAFLQKEKSNIPVYSDSLTAMKWVRVKKINTTLERNSKTEELFQLVDRAILWLQTHTYSNPVLKWETEAWGEIPADFGRK